jgi:hypothetical protein
MGHFISADRKFGNMRSHGAVGQLQHHVFTGGAALFPIFEGETARVGNKVGVPDTAGIRFTFAAEIFRIAVESVGEIALC